MKSLSWIRAPKSLVDRLHKACMPNGAKSYRAATYTSVFAAAAVLPLPRARNAASGQIRGPTYGTPSFRARAIA